jgi:hypothetical protein
MDLVLALGLLVFLMGMALGWVLARERLSLLAFLLESEKEKAQELRLALAKAKAKGYRLEKVQEIELG